jgi:hypothetical protein
MILIEPLKAVHRSFEASHRGMVVDEAKDAAAHIEAQVFQSPRFKPRTQRLQRGTRGTTVIGSNVIRVVGSNRTPYAPFIEYGTKPHIIRARRAKALRFMQRGKVVFRRWVRHPGTRPYQFLYRAVNSAARICNQGLFQDMARIARSF